MEQQIERTPSGVVSLSYTVVRDVNHSDNWQEVKILDTEKKEIKQDVSKIRCRSCMRRVDDLSRCLQCSRLRCRRCAKLEKCHNYPMKVDRSCIYCSIIHSR